MNEYLSKWPYFQMIFFLRDSMMGRKMSINLPQSHLQIEDRGVSCSPPPELSTSTDSAIIDQESTVSKELDTISCFRIAESTIKVTKNRKNLKQDIDEDLVIIEKEKKRLRSKKFGFWLKRAAEEILNTVMLTSIFYEACCLF